MPIQLFDDGESRYYLYRSAVFRTLEHIGIHFPDCQHKFFRPLVKWQIKIYTRKMVTSIHTSWVLGQKWKIGRSKKIVLRKNQFVEKILATVFSKKKFPNFWNFQIFSPSFPNDVKSRMTLCSETNSGRFSQIFCICFHNFLLVGRYGENVFSKSDFFS